jgi:hypothetical protein
MTAFKFTDAFYSHGGVDLSAWVKEINLDYEAETLDETAMGDTTRKNLGGLLNWSASVTFKQDFTASAPDVTLFSTVGTVVTIIIRADKSDGVGATNPNYTGSALVTSYKPFGQGVGDLAMATLELVSAGALSRAVA